MATQCPSFLRGTAMRVTRLDACGRPVYGDCNQVVSDGFVTATLSAEVEEGEAITVTKANGKTCINEPGEDQLQWYTTEIEFCAVDPDMVQIMNSTWDKVLDAQGNVIGYNANGDLGGNGFALEIWMNTYGSADACSGETAQGSWGYILLPWVIGGAPGDIEIGNDAISFTFNGKTKLGSRWRRGPYPVQLQANGAPGPLLQPIGPKTHYRLFTTTVRPPEPECGCQPVERPTPDPAELVLTGVEGENPRRTVRMRVDNHGFGPVSVTWGDSTPAQTVQDGSWVTHTYATDGDFTISVADQQTPAITVSKKITVPLPPDAPGLVLSAGSADDRMQVSAAVTFPPQAAPQGTIDWGDGTEVEEITVGADGSVSVTHVYAASGVYTVTVRRSDVDSYRTRDAIAVPVPEAPTLTVAEDTADTTGNTAQATWDNHDDGAVTVSWGDNSAPYDGAASGSATHAYAAAGEYTVTVTSKANPASSASQKVTIPFP